MDPAQRAAWRQRLTTAYGSWLCSRCKTAYASQQQFEQMVGVVELTRHSECGHVIMYRSGGSDFVKRYLEESHAAALQIDAAQPDPTPRGERRW